MSTQVLHPRHLSREELDAFLARGWYRIGQTLMTCRFLLFNGVLRPVVWTRLPVDDEPFSKSNRKLLRKIRRRFQVTDGPLQLDDERAALYRRYLQVARGQRAPTLEDFLFGDSERDLFETWEITIRQNGRLVAFSWFDLGEDGVQSLLGTYDPEFGKHSLGYASMLLEVEWAREHGRNLHYAGYIVPGDSAMDYKLRVGEVEWLDQDTGRWEPWSTWSEDALPTRRLHRALEDARQALDLQGVSARIREYRWFELPAYERSLDNALDQPLVIECFPDRHEPTVLLVTYDLETRLYALVRCVRVAGLLQTTADGPGQPVQVWVVSERLGHRSAPEVIAAEAARLGDRRWSWWRRK